MDVAIGGGNFFHKGVEGVTGEVGYFAPGFLYQQHTGSGVPGIEFEFPETVVAAGCGIG